MEDHMERLETEVDIWHCWNIRSHFNHAVSFETHGIAVDDEVTRSWNILNQYFETEGFNIPPPHIGGVLK